MIRFLPEEVFFVGQLNFVCEVNQRNSRYKNLVSQLLTVRQDEAGIKRRKLVIFMHRNFEDLPSGIYDVVVTKKPEDNYGVAILREHYRLSINLELGEQVLEGEGNFFVAEAKKDDKKVHPSSLRDFLLILKKLFPVVDLFDLEKAVEQSNWPEIRAKILSTYPERKLTDELAFWLTRLICNAHVIRRMVEQTPVPSVVGSFKEESVIGTSAT